MALVHEPVSTNKLEAIDNSRAAYPFQKDDQIGASKLWIWIRELDLAGQ